ncbi:MAG: hypothetical protein K2O10_00535 [Muribaculaceae bacterium]|nr:hypothetical protein [Muribaculaceae bacterium]
MKRFVCGNTPAGRKVADIVCMACVAVSVAASCACVNVGVPGLLDESYQALCVRQYAESPLAMGMFWVGNLWTRLWGDGYLSLRWLSWLVSLLAVTATSAYLWHVVKSWRVAAWVFVLAMVMGSVGRHTMYNWDTGFYLVFALAEIAALHYARTRSVAGVVALGVTTALVVVARVPAAVVVPLACVLVCGRPPAVTWRCGRAIAVVLYLLAVAATIVLAAIAMCGSVQAYLAAFSPANIINGHSVDNLDQWISYMRDHLYNSMAVWMFSLGAIGLGLWLSAGRRPARPRAIAAVVAAMALGVVEGIYITPLCYMESGAGPVSAALMMFLLLVVPVYKRAYGGKVAFSAVAAAILWVGVAVPAFGSNLWFRRVLTYYQLPLAVVAVLPAAWRVAQLRRLLVSVFVMALCGGGAMLVTRIVISRGFSQVAMDDYPRCGGVVGDVGQVLWCNDVRSLYEAAAGVVGSDRVNIDGMRYFFDYSLKSTPVNNLHRFYFNDNDANVSARREMAPLYDAWLFVDVEPDYYRQSIAMLEDKGFEVVWDDVCGDRGNILLLRQEYVPRFLSRFGCMAPACTPG